MPHAFDDLIFNAVRGTSLVIRSDYTVDDTDAKVWCEPPDGEEVAVAIPNFGQLTHGTTKKVTRDILVLNRGQGSVRLEPRSGLIDGQRAVSIEAGATVIVSERPERSEANPQLAEYTLIVL